MNDYLQEILGRLATAELVRRGTLVPFDPADWEKGDEEKQQLIDHALIDRQKAIDELIEYMFPNLHPDD